MLQPKKFEKQTKMASNLRMTDELFIGDCEKSKQIYWIIFHNHMH